MIAYLADHPQFAEQLAPLLHAEWGHLHPGATVADRLAMIRRHMHRDRLPLAIVLHDGGRLQGTASLNEDGVPERPDMQPWLAGVYVLEEHRGRGLGARLVRAAEAEARRLGVERLYLVTAPGQVSFYAGLGWREVGHRMNGEELEIVMVREIRAGEE